MADALIPPSPTDEQYAVDEDQGDVFTINDPIALFALWLEEAGRHEPNDPNAMALATVDETGLPNVRMVLLKHFDACGFTFHTNLESAKGEELAATPKAALCFHWKTIRRQVRLRGLMKRIKDEEADAYFATRSRGAQIGAIVSDQSRPLADRETLERAISDMERETEGRELARPEHWSGFRLEPLEIEFWVNRPYRLHDRLHYWREATAGDWESERLYP